MFSIQRFWQSRDKLQKNCYIYLFALVIVVSLMILTILFELLPVIIHNYNYYRPDDENSIEKGLSLLLYYLCFCLVSGLLYLWFYYIRTNVVKAMFVLHFFFIFPFGYMLNLGFLEMCLGKKIDIFDITIWWFAHFIPFLLYLQGLSLMLMLKYALTKGETIIYKEVVKEVIKEVEPKENALLKESPLNLLQITQLIFLCFAWAGHWYVFAIILETILRKLGFFFVVNPYNLYFMAFFTPFCVGLYLNSQKARKFLYFIFYSLWFLAALFLCNCFLYPYMSHWWAYLIIDFLMLIVIFVEIKLILKENPLSLILLFVTTLLSIIYLFPI